MHPSELPPPNSDLPSGSPQPVATTTFLKMKFLDPQIAKKAKKLVIICGVIVIALIAALIGNIVSGKNVAWSLISLVIWLLLPAAGFFGLKRNKVNLMGCFCGCSLCLGCYYVALFIWMIFYAVDSDEHRGAAIYTAIAFGVVSLVLFAGYRVSVPMYRLLKHNQLLVLPPNGIPPPPPQNTLVVAYGQGVSSDPYGHYSQGAYIQPVIYQHPGPHYPPPPPNHHAPSHVNPYDGNANSHLPPATAFQGQGHKLSAYDNI